MSTTATHDEPTTDNPIVRNLEAGGPAASDGRPTRFRKDILRVGTYYPAGKRWDVDLDTLNSIAGSFHRARTNGNRIPLVWDHDNSSRANAGEVVDLSVEGDTLYSTIHAQDPAAKKRLGTVNNEVSVQVVQPWTDGRGNRYDHFLTHVAIVNHPIMPDQGEFHEFSNRGPTMARTLTMAEDVVEGATESAEGTAEATAETTEDTMMPVADVIAILESALGVTFPPEVDTKKELKIALDAMLGGGQPAEPAAEAVAAAPDAMAGMEVQQLSTLSLPAARNALAATQRQLSSMIASQRAAAEATFRGRLESLVNAGRVAARTMSGLLDAGKAGQWSMAILAPFDDDSPTMPTTPKSVRTLASTNVPGENVDATVKRHQDRLRKRFGLKAKD